VRIIEGSRQRPHDLRAARAGDAADVRIPIATANGTAIQGCLRPARRNSRRGSAFVTPPIVGMSSYEPGGNATGSRRKGSGWLLPTTPNSRDRQARLALAAKLKRDLAFVGAWQFNTQPKPLG
jgi:hypothetical protein